MKIVDDEGMNEIPTVSENFQARISKEPWRTNQSIKAFPLLSIRRIFERRGYTPSRFFANRNCMSGYCSPKKSCKLKLDRRSNVSRRIHRQRRQTKTFVVYGQSYEQVFPQSQTKNSGSGRHNHRSEFHWENACVDTGAQKTAVGLRRVQVYCPYVGVKFKPCKNNNFYRFVVNLQ